MVRAIVGANWGDEGKGKITDLFAGQSDIVIRVQQRAVLHLSLVISMLKSAFR